MRAAEQRGEILQANHQPGPESAKAHDIMNIAGQHRQRQADGEVAGKVKDNDRDNPQIEAQSIKRRFGDGFGHQVPPDFDNQLSLLPRCRRKSSPPFGILAVGEPLHLSGATHKRNTYVPSAG
ncbi:hypothetical protein [Klebsiella pneumoniae IS46]|nr:hypothetical protein [Klebsiella pneumoniae IS10]CDL16579.1 hypothetical protein [Klebsiella pneumoniae IS46]CDL44521.1 hypothetical protein [Klebsiella pneumoniae ISC21]